MMMYRRIADEFGENWIKPKQLIVCPDFIVDHYETSLTTQRDLDTELMLDFSGAIIKILEEKNNVIVEEGNRLCSLSGYLMFDVDLKDLRPGENMKIHAMLFSSQMVRVIEVLDDENCLESAEKHLTRLTRAIATFVKDKVPVKGVIVFPRTLRQPTSFMTSENLLLYKDELEKVFMGFYDTFPVSDHITEDVKAALAEMFQICYFNQCHPRSKEQAFRRAAQRLFLQRPEEVIKDCAQIDFNLIKLTDIQTGIKDKLLVGNTLVWGGYGMGKSVAIVAAVKELIEKYKKLVKEKASKQTDFKILFLSAQGLLSDKDLPSSPFLLMIEKWVREVCEDIGCDGDLDILSHTLFVNRSINFAMQTQTRNRNKQDVIFCSYLLKRDDFKILTTSGQLLCNFDIIVLEETNAIESSLITDFASCFKREFTINQKNPKVWMTSNTEKPNFNLPGFTVSPKSHVTPYNFRNTPAIFKLADAINSNIGPERYPSTVLPASLIKCQIGLTYEFESDAQKRLGKIIKEVKKWKQMLKNSSLLLIDCEDASLYQELVNENICFKTYKDKYDINELLVLHHLDPIEAVVAGAEWQVIIMHITAKTMNSIDVIKLFSKRIISRATIKIVIFSDRYLDITKIENSNLTDDENSDCIKESIDKIQYENFEEKQIELSSEYNHYNGTAMNTDTLSNNSAERFVSTESEFSDDVGNAIKNFEKFYSNMTSSDEKFKRYEGYTFIQIRHLDDSLRHESNDTYLVHWRDKACVVQLNCDDLNSCKVVQSRSLLENMWNVKLPAYCGGNLVSPCNTENVIRISKLLDLLQPKILSLENNRSGIISIKAEEADEFTKHGKNALIHSCFKLSMLCVNALCHLLLCPLQIKILVICRSNCIVNVFLLVPNTDFNLNF